MQIDLTPEEYSDLLDLLAVGEWALQDIPGDAQIETRPYLELITKLHTYASEFKCGHLIEFLPELGEPSRTEVFYESSPSGGIIDECEDRVFWDELVARLAEEEIFATYTEPQIQAMSEEDRLDLVERTEVLVYKRLKEKGLGALQWRD